jgi:flagellar L-ring protein precursor FlgH
MPRQHFLLFVSVVGLVFAPALYGQSTPGTSREPTSREPTYREPGAPVASARRDDMAQRRFPRYEQRPAYAPGAQRTRFMPAGPQLLENRSWYYVPPEAPKKVRLHDVITIVVEDGSTVLSEGEVDRRKNGLYDAVLAEWIKLGAGLSLKPDPQTDGEPSVSGKVQQTYRAESSLETANRIQFKIAATVVDIRPNGYFVVEAHKTFMVDRERWETSLTGIVPPEAIQPGNNSVLSDRVAELKVRKSQRGHVRDGYRRGWLTRAIDALSPF